MRAHPGPEELAALAAEVSATTGHLAAADADLLGHAVILGDHTTQAAVDDMVDDALEALRELTVSCREVSLALAADGPTSRRAGTGQHHPVWEGR